MYIYTLLVQSDTLEPKNICIKCSKVTFPTIFTPLQFILNSSAGAASSAASVRGEMEMFVRPSIVFILVSAVTQLSVEPGLLAPILDVQQVSDVLLLLCDLRSAVWPGQVSTDNY